MFVMRHFEVRSVAKNMRRIHAYDCHTFAGIILVRYEEQSIGECPKIGAADFNAWPVDKSVYR